MKKFVFGFLIALTILSLMFGGVSANQKVWQQTDHQMKCHEVSINAIHNGKPYWNTEEECLAAIGANPTATPTLISPTSTPTVVVTNTIVPTATCEEDCITSTPTSIPTEITPTIVPTDITPTPIVTPISTPLARLNSMTCAQMYSNMGSQKYSDQGKKMYYSKNPNDGALMRCYWYQGHGSNQRNSHGSIIAKPD
jgi:hypothetical protein